jgi:hypothetical protein
MAKRVSVVPVDLGVGSKIIPFINPSTKQVVFNIANCACGELIISKGKPDTECPKCFKKKLKAILKGK